MEKSFQRRFFEFASGAGVAQLLSFLLMPIISRLYSPSEMGEYAIYAATGSILAVIANLRLDSPVVIARDEDEALKLVQLGHIASVALSVIAFFGLMLFAFVADIKWMTPVFCLLTSVSAGAIGASQSLINYLNRHQRYRQLAVRNALDRIAGLGLSIALALLSFTSLGMPLGQTIGLGFTLCYLFWVAGIRRGNWTWEDLIQTFSGNIDFPRKNLLSNLLYTGSIFGPSLLFAAFFKKSELGSLNLAMRVFDAPIYLLGNTFQVVYYRHISQKAPAEKRRLFWRSLRVLAGLAVVPFAFVGIKGEWIFTLVFGSQWTIAGALAFWLAPLNLARLFFVSQTPVLVAERRLWRDLLSNILLFAAQVVGFFVGYAAYGTVSATLAFMCIFGMAAYLIGVGVIYAAIKH